jgi:hypothetical protein
MHGLVLVLKHETFYGRVSTSVVADVVGNNTILSGPRSTWHLLMTHTYIPDMVNSFVCFHTLTTTCPSVWTLSLLSITPIPVQLRIYHPQTTFSALPLLSCLHCEYSSVLPPTPLARVTSLTIAFDFCVWWDNERGSSVFLGNIA